MGPEAGRTRAYEILIPPKDGQPVHCVCALDMPSIAEGIRVCDARKHQLHWVVFSGTLTGFASELYTISDCFSLQQIVLVGTAGFETTTSTV